MSSAIDLFTFLSQARGGGPSELLGGGCHCYMDGIYNEFTVNGDSLDHIQYMWTPFTLNSL